MTSYSIDSVVNSLTAKTSLSPAAVEKFRTVAHWYKDMAFLSSFYKALDMYGTSLAEPVLDEMITDGAPAELPQHQLEDGVRAFDNLASEPWVSLIKSYKPIVQPNAFSGFAGVLADHEGKADTIYRIMSNPELVRSVNSLDDESLSYNDDLSLDVFSTLLFSAQETLNAELIILAAQAASKYKGETAKEVAHSILYIARYGDGIDTAKSIADIFKTDEVANAVNSLGSSTQKVARDLIGLNSGYDATNYLSKAAIALGRYKPEVAEYFADRLRNAALYASIAEEENFKRAVAGIDMQKSVEAIAKYDINTKLLAAKEIFDSFAFEGLDAGKNAAQILGRDEIVAILDKYSGVEELVLQALRMLRVYRNLSPESPDFIPTFVGFLSQENIYNQLRPLPKDVQDYIIHDLASRFTIVAYKPVNIDKILEESSRTIQGFTLPESLECIAKHSGQDIGVRIGLLYELGYTFLNMPDRSGIAVKAFGTDEAIKVLNKYKEMEFAIFQAMRGLIFNNPEGIHAFVEFMDRDSTYNDIIARPREIRNYLISGIASKIGKGNSAEKAEELMRIINFEGVKATIEKYRGQGDLADKVAFELIMTAIERGTPSAVFQKALLLQNRVNAELLDIPNLNKFW